MAGEGSASFFEKKEAKKLYPFGSSGGEGRSHSILASPFSLVGSRGSGGGSRPTLRSSVSMAGGPQWIKVFCFFFSKKKRLPCLGLA
jgi:hypothetical protein